MDLKTLRLAVAQNFATEQGKRVMEYLTDHVLHRKIGVPTAEAAMYSEGRRSVVIELIELAKEPES